MTNSTEEKRIFGLDLIRTVAVLSVLLAHTLSLLSTNRAFVNMISFAATLGVELFFVLSGFLIGTILIKTHNKDEITTFSSIKVFWVRRWFRTLPNYYLMFGVFFALMFVGHQKVAELSIWDYLIRLVFLQNAVSQEQNAFYGVAWSLCIEEWFYLLFPLILFVAQYVFKKKAQSLLITILLFIALPLIGRILLAKYGNIEWDAGFRKMLFIRLDGIGIGVLGAFINYYFNNFWNDKKWILFFSGLVGFALMYWCHYNNVAKFYDYENLHETVDPGFFMKTFFFTLFSFSIAMLLPLMYSIEVKRVGIFYHFVSVISIISYSIYLTHLVVILFIGHFLKNSSGVVQFPVVWIITFIVSYFQYHLFEKRITALRKHFGDKKYAVSLLK